MSALDGLEYAESFAAAFPKPRRLPRDDPRFHIGLRSLSVRPHDNVLSTLDGAGLEAEAYLSPVVHVGGGLYWLDGQVRKSSPARGGIEAPWEFALDVRTRMMLRGGRTLGMNGFFGLRFGELEWDYANPVYAIDSAGNGAEIWKDSISNATVYCGIGLVPLQTRFLRMGVDLGAGWRGYFNETLQEFANDLFKDGWMTQVSVMVAIEF